MMNRVRFQNKNQKRSRSGERLGTVQEVGYKKWEREVNQHWTEILKHGTEPFNQYWRNGGHGEKCKCHYCRDKFHFINDMDKAYDQLTNKLMNNHKKETRFYNQSHMRYYVQPPTTGVAIRNHEMNYKGAVIRMQQWITDNCLFHNPPDNMINYGLAPDVHNIILDETALYTETAAAEYYFAIDGRHPHQMGQNKLEKISRSSHALDKTMIIDIRDLSTQIDDKKKSEYRQKIQEMLNIFGTYSLEKRGEPIAVYMIYGKKGLCQYHQCKDGREICGHNMENDATLGLQCTH